MGNGLRILCLWCFVMQSLLDAASAWAQITLPTIVYDNSLEQIDITSNMVVLLPHSPDPIDEATASQAVRKLVQGVTPQNSWQSNRSSWGIRPTSLWMLGKVMNQGSGPREIAFGPARDMPYSITFIVLDEQLQLIKRHHTGSRTPLAERDFKAQLAGIRLELKAGEVRYILVEKVSFGVMSGSFVIRSLSQQDAEERWGFAIYGVYFGVALALLFHNLTLYLSMRDRVYLNYALFNLGTSGSVLFISNYYALVWWAVPDFLATIPHGMLALTNAAAVGLYTSYLRLSWKTSWLARISWILAGLSVLTFFLIQVEPRLGMAVNSPLNMLVALLSIVASGMRLARGMRFALYFFLASLAPAVAVLVSYVLVFAFKMSASLDIFAMAFGVEMTLMSVGLSERIYSLRMREQKLDTERHFVLRQSRLEAVSDLASSVAHEVNNPLMIISSASEVLVKQVQQSEIDRQKMTKLGQTIGTSAERIAFIVRALRHYSHGSEDLMTPKLSDILREAVVLSETYCFTRGVRIEATGYETKGITSASHHILLRLIVELVSLGSYFAARSEEKLVHLQLLEVSAGLAEIHIQISGGLDVRSASAKAEPRNPHERSATSDSHRTLTQLTEEAQTIGVNLLQRQDASRMILILQVPLVESVLEQAS